VLLEQLEKLQPEKLEKEGIMACVFRVDPRISKEVWRMVLQFLYTGVLYCTFTSEAQRVLELLRACAMYKLPKPILEFTQASIFQLLPASPPQYALHVFSITSGACSEDLDVRSSKEASLFILLRSASQVFESMDPDGVAKILERMVQAVEFSVFNPSGQSQENSLQHQQQQQQQHQHLQQQQHPGAVQDASGNWHPVACSNYLPSSQPCAGHMQSSRQQSCSQLSAGSGGHLSACGSYPESNQYGWR